MEQSYHLYMVHFRLEISKGYILNHDHCENDSTPLFNSLFSDRNWSLETCPLTDCKATSVVITEEAKPKRSDTKIVAVGSSVGCTPDVSYGFQMVQENTVTEYRSFTISKSTTWSFGASFYVMGGM